MLSYVQRDFPPQPVVGPLCRWTASDQEHGVKAVSVSQKSFFVLKSQSILPSKVCPGSRRKWVRVCAMPCFSERGHYRRSAETEREVRLGCFVRDYCFTPWSFIVLLLSVSLCSFPSRLVCAYTLALLSFTLFTVSPSIFPSLTLFCHRYLFRSGLIVNLVLLFFGLSNELVKWHSVQKMENHFSFGGLHLQKDASGGL